MPETSRAVRCLQATPICRSASPSLATSWSTVSKSSWLPSLSVCSRGAKSGSARGARGQRRVRRARRRRRVPARPRRCGSCNTAKRVLCAGSVVEQSRPPSAPPRAGIPGGEAALGAEVSALQSQLRESSDAAEAQAHQAEAARAATAAATAPGAPGRLSMARTRGVRRRRLAEPPALSTAHHPPTSTRGARCRSSHHGGDEVARRS